MKRINILHLRDSPWVCGPGRTILESAAHIDEKKYGYTIGAFSRAKEENPFLEAGIKKGIDIIPIYEYRSLDLGVFKQISRIIKEKHIDILHTHEVRSDVIGLICAKYLKIPIVVTLHGWIGNGLKGKTYTALDKGILRYFDGVIAVSEEIRRIVLGNGVRSEKIWVLRNALVLDEFKRNRADKRFRKEFGIKDNETLIGNIGRLSPEKGQLEFILAAKEVLNYNEEIKFILIGKGPDKIRLEKCIKDMNIQQHVIFAGFQNDMTGVYNGLDLVVQSSHTEGMPNVILEAMLMEVPIIATSVGGTPEIIKNGFNGILIKEKDVSQIVKSILKILKELNSCKIMVENAKKTIEKQFNFTDRTRKLEIVYESVWNKWKRKFNN